MALAPITPAMPSHVRTSEGAANANSPCSKTIGRYLKRNSNRPSISVAHRVDDDIRAHLVGVRGGLERVRRILRPLPGVAEVGVEVDDHHEAALVVIDAFDL